MVPSPYRKGDLAQVTEGTRFDRPEGLRIYTHEEREALARSDRYKGLDSAGEPILAPYYGSEPLAPGTILHILRARARPPIPVNRRSTGWVLVLDTHSGHKFYVNDRFLRVLTNSPTVS